jgi:electron transport protein HydN
MKSIGAYRRRKPASGRVAIVPEGPASVILDACKPKGEFILKRGSVVFEENGFERSVYYLREGEVELLQNSPAGSVRSVKRVSAGEFFGVSAYPGGGFRYASAAVLGPSVVLKFSCADLKKVVEKDPELKASFERWKKDEKFMTLLPRSDHFGRLAGKEARKLAGDCEIIDFKRGKELPIDESDQIFVLNGYLSLQWTDGGVERMLLLGKDEFWWADLFRLPDAVVSAATDGCALKLNSEMMKELFYGMASFRKSVKRRVSSLRDDIDRTRKDFAYQKKMRFMLESGMVHAEAPPVIDLTRCIRCHACENACMKRHGEKRLDIDATFKLDVFSFPVACHKCEVPTCIQKCAKAAMTRGLDGEVVVDTEACVGCGACAKGCPFDAIKLIPADGTGDEYSDARSAPGAGSPDGVAGKAGKTPVIASKCDRCHDYCDQACVRECPTGALSRILPFKT